MRMRRSDRPRAAGIIGSRRLLSLSSAEPIPMTPIHVLFLCTGNSARSILAEATLNHLGKGRFVAHSAGSHPAGKVHPQAVRQLEAESIPVSGYRSKSWDEFAGPDAPRLDLVVTVCDSAARETCPVFFGDFVLTHWGLPDPAAITAPAEAVERAFAEAHKLVTHRIAQLLQLPFREMERGDLRERLGEIGTSQP